MEADELGRFVRFHYSGNANDEVPLIGEEDPLLILLIMWGLPLMLMLMLIYHPFGNR